MTCDPKCPVCNFELGLNGGHGVDPAALYTCTGRTGCVRAEKVSVDHLFPAAGTEGGAAFDMLLPSEAWDEIVPHPLVPFGFAPGLYFCRCSSCGRKFEGAKRAHHCRVCAERQLHRAEITRLRAEVERLRLACGEYDEELNGREAEAARAARDRAVAEAVREAAARRSEFGGLHSTHSRIMAIDLDAVIASIAKEAQG